MSARAGAALGGLAALLYLGGLAAGAPLLCLATKPVPVLALGAWVWSARGQAHGRYARRIAAGLGLSAVGDLLLEFPHGFVAGLTAFLLAHLAYIAAFLGETRTLRAWRALPFLAYGAAAFNLLRPGLAGLVAPVAAYGSVLTAMQWRAAACVGATARGRAAEWAALAGAVLFALSDSLLAVDRFRAPFGAARYVIILLYWAGQFGLAWSARPGATR